MPTTQLSSLPSWEKADCPLYLVPSAYSLLPSHQISGDEFYSEVAKGILQYVARNLSHRVCVR